MSTYYLGRGQVYLNGRPIGVVSEMSVPSSIGSVGVVKNYEVPAKKRQPTYGENLRSALAGEGARYMEGWSTGTWARMSSRKAKRIMRLKRYMARIQRLEGM